MDAIDAEERLERELEQAKKQAKRTRRIRIAVGTPAGADVRAAESPDSRGVQDHGRRPVHRGA